MPSTDPDRARSRFINAVKRFIEGARMQRERTITATTTAPRLFEGTPYEAVDLTGVSGNDLDYYATSTSLAACKMPLAS